MRAEPDVRRPGAGRCGLERRRAGACSLRCCSLPCCCCSRPAARRSEAADPLRPPLAGAGAVAVRGDGHPPGPARLRLARDRGRPRSLRRDLLQGLQARRLRRGLAARAASSGTSSEDTAGDLWIATTGGLASWQQGDRPRRAARRRWRARTCARCASRRRTTSSGSAPATRASSAWRSRRGALTRFAHDPADALEPRRRPDLRALRRSRGPAVGGHRRRPRPARTPGQRLRALRPGRRRRPRA